jgi:hypothetical protein
MLDGFIIIYCPTTVKNPQANAVCKWLHQSIANTLRPLLHAHPLQDVNDAAFIINTALSTAAHSAQAAIHSTLKISPGSLVFHEDMFLDIPIITDFYNNNAKRLLTKISCVPIVDAFLMTISLVMKSFISYTNL